MTADTGDGRTPTASSFKIWMSSCPTSIGSACSTKPSRWLEFSHDVAASRLAKRWRMTQSICAGGFGGMTVCSMKPENPATTAPILFCQRANSSSLPAFTRVCVTTVTPPGVAVCVTLIASCRACRRCGPV
jgi:hypothetical protein